MAEAVVDTNILVRIATGDLPDLARKAVVLIKAYKKHQIVLPESVFAEVVFVLSSKKNYKFTRVAVAASLLEILGIEQFACDRELLEKSAQLYGITKLDFVDCLVLAYAKLGRVAKLVSFDTELIKSS